MRLARLFMRGMLAAPAAILLVLDPSRLLLLVLRGRVVAAFALSAFECYNVSHSVLVSLS